MNKGKRGHRGWSVVMAGVWAAAMVFAGIPGSAQATPQLKLISGTTVYGTSIGAGVVQFSGSVASFIVNVTTGTSKPTLGSISEPAMDLNSVNVSDGTGTVDIWFTDTGFANAASALQFLTSVGGTAGHSATFTYYADPSNTAYGTADLISTFNATSAGAFDASATQSIAGLGSGPFSLTLHMQVVHTSGVQVSSFDQALGVPEPGTLALLGLGLVGLGAASASRRRRRQSAGSSGYRHAA